MNQSYEILKGKFIKRVFQQTSVDIEKAQTKLMRSRGFENSDWDDRTFHVSDSALTYQHLGKHRFVDMRTRLSKDGNKRKKKSHAIHNRIIFGNYNNIIRELTFGFTEAVKDELFKLE